MEGKLTLDNKQVHELTTSSSDDTDLSECELSDFELLLDTLKSSETDASDFIIKSI